jgi:transcriptional regulator with XRE-family HTH domain
MIFVYDLIEELCMRKGINITTLCRECKIPRSSLTDYKKGRIKSLSTDTICKIADYFDVSVGYLCGGEHSKLDEEALKTALFGNDVVVTDQMWNEVKNYAGYIKEVYKDKNA